MTLKLGDVAPDFTQESTEGPIHFHEWAGNSWVVLFSHPKDFTPVCTTELGAVARLKSEFDKRSVKVVGLSVDSVGDHTRWANDIKETQGTAPNYPIIADGDFKVSTLYGMLPGGAQWRSRQAHPGRQSDRAQCLRHRSQQEDPPDPRLSHGDRAQFPGDPARHRFVAD